MKLRSPFFIDNLGSDQPYNSMLVIAPYCHTRCPDCHNKHLRSGELKEFTPLGLAEIFLSNPFWEGVTLGGLEGMDGSEHWWKDFKEFLTLANVKKLTVYTSQYSFYPLPMVKELYYKFGDYRPDLPSKEVEVEGWKITLASDNQEFIKIR